MEDERKDERGKASNGEAVEKEERGVQGNGSCRGQGEGTMRLMDDEETRGGIIGTQREAGVGEEVLHIQEGRAGACEEPIQSKRRGEAEGGQKEGGKQKEDGEDQAAGTGSLKIIRNPKKLVKQTIVDQDVNSLYSPNDLLANRLQEAQEEADRQAKAAQDLRSKLGEQSRKSWESEQKLVLVEAELQHLRKAAESLSEARRQIEVRMAEKRARMGRWWRDGRM